MFKQNQFGTGIIIGIIGQILFFVIIYVVNHVLSYHHIIESISLQTMVITSITLNVLLIRYFFIKRKMEKTGTGILVATFVLTALTFIIVSVFYKS